MDIFFNERRIRLLDRKPFTREKKSLVVAFESKKQLDTVYRNFESHDEIPELILWSKKEFDKLCKKFFSMFTLIEAAGGLVENEEGDLLFIYRFEHWDLPKGKIEEQDMNSASAAAIREVKEETGLEQADIQVELSSTWHIYPHKNKRILKCTRWFKMHASSSHDLLPQADEGILQVKWIPKKELPAILPRTYASLRELIKLQVTNYK